MATFVVPGSTSTGSVPNRLGVGVAYPPRHNEAGGVGVFRDEELVRASIQLMLDADVYELPYEVTGEGVGVGTGVRAILFEDTQHIREVLGYRVKASVDAWERRVQILGVDVAPLPTDGTTDGMRTVTVVVRYKFRLSDSGERSLPFQVQVRLASEA